MGNRFTRGIRSATRLLVFAVTLAAGLARFAAFLISQRRFPNRLERAAWLHSVCQRVARVLHLEWSLIGQPPSNGLLVCNHLSYVDIVLLSAITPCVFISKSDVKHWPVFGWFASLAGTVFVRRTAHTSLKNVVQGVRDALDEGTLVVLFPEGTTTDGQTVHPFKSPLLEAATGRSDPITVGFIDYTLPEGNVAEEVCYWRDMTLVPHLLNLMSKPRIQASISFSRHRAACPDRKSLAGELHRHVVELQHAARPIAVPRGSAANGSRTCEIAPGTRRN